MTPASPTSLETQVAQHSVELSQITRTLTEISGEIKENRRHSDANFELLTNKMSAIGRANLPLLISVTIAFLGFASSLVVGGYFVIQLSIANAVTPVKATAASAAETVTTLAASHSALAHQVTDNMTIIATNRARIEATLIEIETQFRASDEFRNMQAAANSRQLATMWSKIFPDIPYPAAVYYPHIAK